jgi:hypothetical protein
MSNQAAEPTSVAQVGPINVRVSFLELEHLHPDVMQAHVHGRLAKAGVPFRDPRPRIRPDWRVLRGRLVAVGATFSERDPWSSHLEYVWLENGQEPA